jgi:hypothetical protein
VALDVKARPSEMDDGAATLDFFDDLGYRCGSKSDTAPGSGTRYGSTPNLRVVRVVAVVPAEISGLLLGADRWQCGSMPTCLIKEVVHRFFARKDDVMFDLGSH